MPNFYAEPLRILFGMAAVAVGLVLIGGAVLFILGVYLYLFAAPSSPPSDNTEARPASGAQGHVTGPGGPRLRMHVTPQSAPPTATPKP